MLLLYIIPNNIPQNLHLPLTRLVLLRTLLRPNRAYQYRQCAKDGKRLTLTSQNTTLKAQTEKAETRQSLDLQSLCMRHASIYYKITKQMASAKFSGDIYG